jgi:ubiquinone/menaquinone biosynthesis C-methylase UbiE
MNKRKQFVEKQANTNEIEMLTPILFGASAFQYLNAGCELGLFDLLQHSLSLSKVEIQEALKLHARAVDTLLLGLTSLKLIRRKNERYENSITIASLFENDQWTIFKDVVAFEQYIVYLSQVDFVESLKTNTNIGIKRIPGKGRDLYHRLSENPILEEVFYKYMDSWTRLTNHHLLNNIDYTSIKNVLDVGGGTGINAMAIAKKFPHIKSTIFEIPGSAEIAQANINAAGLSNTIVIHTGDMFAEDFPPNHDCVLFSHQLVIWTPEENLKLMKKAFNILPEGGKIIIFSSISNDEGTGPLMAALDSVYFSTLPAEGGMIYAWNQYEGWLKQCGFKSIKRVNCYGWTPHGIIEATK